MIEIFSYILGFLTLIMVITAIHEAGHFYVARFFNVKILDFSIGMGKSIKNYIGKDGTSYNLRLFPIGGYVKMLGEDVMEKNSNDIDDSFASKKYYQKVLILFAGPFANFLLAVFLFTILNLIGSTVLSSQVGYVLPESAASKANITEGDLIIEIDDKNISSRADAQMALSRRLGESGEIKFKLNSNGSTKETKIDVEDWLIGEEPKDLLSNLGIGIPVSSEIGTILENSPANKAGLISGDKVLEIEAQKISSWGQIKDVVDKSLGMPLKIKILRDNEEIFFQVTPTFSDSRWVLGITSANKFSESSYIYKSYSPINAFTNALEKTYSTIVDSFIFLYKMIGGYVSPKNLGGPVMIGQVAGESLIYGGFYSFLLLMSFVSIGLGVINLVPIPILDGGQICLLTLERLKGSPISPRTLDFVYRVGLSMVIFLMIFVFINDLSRLSVL